MIGFVELSLKKDTDLARHVPHVLPWLHEAGNPYFDWFFGNAQTAQSILGRWIVRPSSEVSLKRTVVLQEDGRIIGGIIGMNGTDLALCRKADTLALMRDWPPSDRESIVRRMRESAGLFHIPDAHHYYLSKIGLLPEARRKGFGRMLLEAFLVKGSAGGFTRFMLDVSADNALAVKLYMSAGFHVVRESQHPSGTMTYLSMILNRQK